MTKECVRWEINEWQASKHLLSSRSERKIRCRLKRLDGEEEGRGEEEDNVNNVERGDEEEWVRASREDINFK